MRSITLPEHAVSALCLVWRREDSEEKPVVARFAGLVRSAVALRPA